MNEPQKLRFLEVGNFFMVDGTGPYLGLAIASQEAFYVVTALEPFNLISLFTGRIGTKLSGDSGPFQIRLSDLPNAVTEDSAWPVKTKEGFVCVFPRNSFSNIHCSLIGKVRITNPDHSATIKSGIFSRFRLMRTLREMGWDV